MFYILHAENFVPRTEPALGKSESQTDILPSNMNLKGLENNNVKVTKFSRKLLREHYNFFSCKKISTSFLPVTFT